MMNFNEQIEEHLAKFGDYYHVGSGRYECRDTGHIGTFAQIVGIKVPGAPKPAPASAAKKAAAKSARDEIKHIGYRALKSGTPKQQAWAETIRTGMVKSIAEDVQAAFTDAPFHTAKFWIDNRDKTASDFTQFARDDIAMHEMIWSAHNAGDFEKSRRIRDQRGALHRKFGI